MSIRRKLLIVLFAAVFSHAVAGHLLAQNTRPTIVIVHGAWGGAWAFRKVDAELREKGYNVYRPELTGLGERVHLSRPDIGLSTHIEDVVNMILFEDLHDIILVGHSYGGMVITGVADRVPDRIKHLIYLDALVPDDGESLNTVLGRPSTRPIEGGFMVPQWVKPDQKPPHDVPMPAKCFSEPVALKNQDAAKKIQTTYILTVDPGKEPEKDQFYSCYQRAQTRG